MFAALSSKIALLVVVKGVHRSTGGNSGVAGAYEELIDPVTYLKASGEILFLALGGCLIITAIWNRGIYSDNMLRDRIGYNDVWRVYVGFDTTPAKYYATPMFTIGIYLGIRFVWLNNERVKMRRAAGEVSRCTYRLSGVANFLYILSLCLFPLTLVIPPVSPYTVWSHSGCFLQMIPTRFAAVAAVFREADTVRKREWAFLAVYGFLSFAFPLLLIIDYASYDARYGMTAYDSSQPNATKPPEDPLIPGAVTAVFDYSWFVCLGATSMMMPANPLLCTKWTLADVERGQNSERVDPAEEPGEGDQSGGAGSEDCGCKKEPSEPSGRIGKRSGGLFSSLVGFLFG